MDEHEPFNKTRHNPISIIDFEWNFSKYKNKYYNEYEWHSYVFYNVYKFTHWQGTGIRMFLHKYNHLQPTDAADFCHGRRDSESSHIFVCKNTYYFVEF